MSVYIVMLGRFSDYYPLVDRLIKWCFQDWLVWDDRFFFDLPPFLSTLYLWRGICAEWVAAEYSRLFALFCTAHSNSRTGYPSRSSMTASTGLVSVADSVPCHIYTATSTTPFVFFCPFVFHVTWAHVWDLEGRNPSLVKIRTKEWLTEWHGTADIVTASLRPASNTDGYTTEGFPRCISWLEDCGPSQPILRLLDLHVQLSCLGCPWPLFALLGLDLPCNPLNVFISQRPLRWLIHTVPADPQISDTWHWWSKTTRLPAKESWHGGGHASVHSFSSMPLYLFIWIFINLVSHFISFGMTLSNVVCEFVLVIPNGQFSRMLYVQIPGHTY